MCDGNCIECGYPDCLSDNPPIVDLDEYLQLDRDTYVITGTEKLPELKAPEIIPEETLYLAISDDLRAFCDAHKVKPRVMADVAILERAMKNGFQGKKLEKALYKVRNREKYLMQKARYRSKKLRSKTVRHEN